MNRNHLIKRVISRPVRELPRPPTDFFSILFRTRRRRTVTRPPTPMKGIVDLLFWFIYTGCPAIRTSTGCEGPRYGVPATPCNITYLDAAAFTRPGTSCCDFIRCCRVASVSLRRLFRRSFCFLLADGLQRPIGQTRVIIPRAVATAVNSTSRRKSLFFPFLVIRPFVSPSRLVQAAVTLGLEPGEAVVVQRALGKILQHQIGRRVGCLEELVGLGLLAGLF